jgi:hypothetical protein
VSWYDEATKAADKQAEEQATLSLAGSWKPDKNEDDPNPLVGIVFNTPSVRDTKYGGRYVLYVHQTDENDELLFKPAVDDDGEEIEGEVVPVLYEVFASRAVLVRNLQDAAPGKGSPIFIRWEGQVESTSGGRKYHSYTAMAGEPDADLWAKLVRDKMESDNNVKPDVDDSIATEEDLEKVF